MFDVVAVKFRYAAHDLWFDPANTGVTYGDHAICKTARGTEIGLVTSDPRSVSQEELEAITGGTQLQPVLRVATESDLERAHELAERADAAMPVFRRCAKEEGLAMKPIGVEYLFDEGRVVCYFSADERVDFRNLVRDLAHELHCRIDMRQLGVREQAAIVGGYAHCGQELCCTRFGDAFEPVSIRMAKEQDLPLNSTKISGACGRLMCCLRYEFEAYRNFKSRAPKRNALIETPLGQAKVVEYDTPKEQVTLRLENGKSLKVALADMSTSDAACKKSEELGCTCRPDTVERSVLERLESPEVQMALAELDRKNGIKSEPDAMFYEELQRADVSAVKGNLPTPEPKHKRRRRRHRVKDAAHTEHEGAKNTEQRADKRKQAEKSHTSRRQAAERSGKQAADHKQVNHKQAEKSHVRHKQASTSQTKNNQTGSPSQTRDRQTAATSQAKSNQATASSQTKRQRRRPGDKGGAQALIAPTQRRVRARRRRHKSDTQ